MKRGATSRSVRVRVIDSTTFLPASIGPLQAGLQLWYQREREAFVTIAAVSIAALTTAFVAGGFRVINDGYHRLDAPDAAWSAGTATTVAFGGAATGYIIQGVEHPLTAFDPEDSVRAGLTALPNATAGATGGLPTLIRGLTTQSASAAGVQLDAGASSVNDSYIGCYIKTSTESKVILDYVGSTKWAITQIGTLGSPWVSPPSSGAVVEIGPLGLIGASTNTAGEVTVASASAVVIANEVALKTIAGVTTVQSVTNAVSVASASAVVIANEVAGKSLTIGTNNDKTGYSLSTAGQAATQIAAIKTQTDQLGFHNGNVAANMEEINQIPVTGNGSSQPFGV